MTEGRRTGVGDKLALAATLGHFLVVGGVLAALRSAVAGAAAEAPRETLHVALAAGLSAGERARRLDEAVLVEAAVRAGLSRTDPVIVDRLVQNLRFAGEEGDAASLLDRAHALGMHRADPVARRRLVWRAEKQLAARAPRPSQAELAAFRAAHAERYRAPDAVRFTQVFLAAERRGGALATDAAALGRRLAAVGPEQGARWSDPLLHGSHFPMTGLPRVRALLGDEVAAALREAPVGRWLGPVRSAYGLHFVWLVGRRQGELPALTEIEDRVRQDLLASRRRQAVEEGIAALRDRVELAVEEAGAR